MMTIASGTAPLTSHASRISAVAAFVLLVVLAAALPATAQLPEIEAMSAEEILAEVGQSSANVTLVTFWATWCTPCRDEIPALVRIGGERGPEDLRLLFVSADHPEDLPEARRFLAELGVTDRSLIATDADRTFRDVAEFDWSGALPVTVLFSSEGRRIGFWEGARTYEEIVARLRGLRTPPASDDPREGRAPIGASSTKEGTP